MKAAPLEPRRRGRPAARLFFAHEVADLLGVELPWFNSAMDKSAASFFRGAFQDQDGWKIPERDVKALLGPELQRLYSIQEFAWLISKPARTVHSWIECGAIPARKIMGEWRIAADVYYTIPAEKPACLPARPKFGGPALFSRKRAAVRLPEQEVER